LVAKREKNVTTPILYLIRRQPRPVVGKSTVSAPEQTNFYPFPNTIHEQVFVQVRTNELYCCGDPCNKKATFVSDDPTRRFQRTLWDIQKRWGQAAIANGAPPDAHDAIPTGFVALDNVLSTGGIARGRLTVLTGAPTSGLTTLALRVIANGQAVDAVAAYVDLSEAFDADYAARCGVDLDRLLIVQPRDVSLAAAISRDLLRSGLPSVLALDVMAVPSGDVASMLRHLHEPLIRSNCALLALASSTPSSLDYVDTWLHVERLAWCYHHDDICGCQVQITIHKDRPDTGQKQVTVEIDFPAGTEGERL
jgi:hypothetical protein